MDFGVEPSPGLEGTRGKEKVPEPKKYLFSINKIHVCNYWQSGN